MQGGHDDDPDGGDLPVATGEVASGSDVVAPGEDLVDTAVDNPVDNQVDNPAGPSIFDEPPAEHEPSDASPPPDPVGPVLPVGQPKAPLPMVDPLTHNQPAAPTWYRTDEDRARSVYRRANPWYRQLARGVIGLAFLGVAVVGVYAGARAVQAYLDRDRLPAQGADVPDIRATSFIVNSESPAPSVDGTLTIDAASLAFEFVGRADGPQAGLQIVSPDGAAVYVRRGAGPWRPPAPGEPDVDAVRTAVSYLAGTKSADDILTSRLRRGFVVLRAQVDEGTGDDRLVRYEMTFDIVGFAREYPLQWQDYRSNAVPGVQLGSSEITIWLDTDNVLVRFDDDATTWRWERLTYSDQEFRPVDPTNVTTARVVQVACVSDDNRIFWQTPLASCVDAIDLARAEAVSAGLSEAFDDLDRTIAQLCSVMEREEGPVAATGDEAALAQVLVDAAVCRGDPAIFAPG